MERGYRLRSCPERVLARISEYAGAGMDSARLFASHDRGLIEAHLARCADCRGEVAIIRGESAEIGIGLPDPAFMLAAIRSRIATDEHSRWDFSQGEAVSSVSGETLLDSSSRVSWRSARSR